ncbi:hypothetical protein [Clostridium formicaceticum]|uniref:Uncharacterized protein n=1 Tax=Clostridium formicaceticum TaxID=1497 RepID=A0AAC9RNS1_9CLOT|nr:hypothetical protein [Clostridium formicaceticum]AOY77919.1 hypothetical protein BJL90_19880 [Clostridium formicaceticum]ARE88540.1 hypothetical protein CLFO_29460 [Clostridium formicaceticum]
MNSFQLLFDIIHLKKNKELSLPQTQATFKAFVDAIFPRTHEEPSGALDLHTEEFLIWVLDHLLSLTIVKKNVNIPMANVTAEMLNIAAKELIDKGENKKSVNPDIMQEKGVFAALDPSDRFRTISLLEELRLDLANLPVPFWNNSGVVLAITSVLTLLTVFGHYSEWCAYDSTKLETVEKRIIQEFPVSWKEVGYPGPSKGYRAFRGYLIE